MILDVMATGHESVFGALSKSERHALAVHMEAAQSEARHSGAASAAMLCELTGLADATERAANREISPSGLVMMERPPRLR